MFMTLNRLGGLIARAKSPHATQTDVERVTYAKVERHHERGPSKLARRMRRKSQLGMAGAF